MTYYLFHNYIINFKQHHSFFSAVFIMILFSFHLCSLISYRIVFKAFQGWLKICFSVRVHSAFPHYLIICCSALFRANQQFPANLCFSRAFLSLKNRRLAEPTIKLHSRFLYNRHKTPCIFCCPCVILSLRVVWNRQMC